MTSRPAGDTSTAAVLRRFERFATVLQMVPFVVAALLIGVIWWASR